MYGGSHSLYSNVCDTGISVVQEANFCLLPLLIIVCCSKNVSGSTSGILFLYNFSIKGLKGKGWKAAVVCYLPLACSLFEVHGDSVACTTGFHFHGVLREETLDTLK